MENNKVWAFISAFIISFLIFNVGSCFVSEYTGGQQCNVMDSLGRPFKAIGDWAGKTFTSTKDKVRGTASEAQQKLKDLTDSISPDEEKKLKQLSCHELVEQAKNPDLLCKVKEKGMDIYNACVGGTENPYSEITRWRIAFEKCQQEYNAASDAQKAALQKDFDTARTRYNYLLGLKALEQGNYDEAAGIFDKVINDPDSSSWLKTQAKNKKEEAQKAKFEKANAEKLKAAEEALDAGKALVKEAESAHGSSPDKRYQLYDKALDNFIEARKTAHEIVKGGGSQ